MCAHRCACTIGRVNVDSAKASPNVKAMPRGRRRGGSGDVVEQQAKQARAASIQHAFEQAIFSSRWLLAPLYLGLCASLLVIAVRFIESLWVLLTIALHGDAHEITLSVLGLLDLTLLANLIIMMIFAGYENFVSRIDVAEGSVDKPHWMGRVDYSGLKVKLIGSLVAISVIELLKDFMRAQDAADFEATAWRIGIHLTFVISGVLFALMDLLADKRVALDMATELRVEEAKRNS